jgi:hypothetical protein
MRAHTATRPGAVIPRRDAQAGPEGVAMYPVTVQYLQTRRVAAALVQVVARLWYLIWYLFSITSTLGGRCGTASGQCCFSQRRCLPRVSLNALRLTTLSNRSSCSARPTGEQRSVVVDCGWTLWEKLT